MIGAVFRRKALCCCMHAGTSQAKREEEKGDRGDRQGAIMPTPPKHDSIPTYTNGTTTNVHAQFPWTLSYAPMHPTTRFLAHLHASLSFLENVTHSLLSSPLLLPDSLSWGDGVSERVVFSTSPITSHHRIMEERIETSCSTTTRRQSAPRQKLAAYK